MLLRDVRSSTHEKKDTNLFTAINVYTCTSVVIKNTGKTNTQCRTSDKTLKTIGEYPSLFVILPRVNYSSTKKILDAGDDAYDRRRNRRESSRLNHNPSFLFILAN